MKLLYCRPLAGGLQIASTRSEHATTLEALQILVFPSLLDEERFKAPHYLKHIEMFPEGQFVVLDGERVVGMTSTIRLDFDFEHLDHGFSEVIQGGWLTSHQPQGAWLYGADIGTHPEYRKRGIARALYGARQDAVRALDLSGQVTVGVLSGYGAVKDDLSIQEYYDQVIRKVRYDPTVSTQLKIGFEARCLIQDYLSDPTCGNAGVLLILDKNRDV